MNEAHQVLVGVAEAHAAANPAFEEGGAAAHIESHHTLVLVPDIGHSVHTAVRGADTETPKQVFPVESELAEGFVSFFAAVEALYHLLGCGSVEQSVRGELFFLWVLHIAQYEDQAAAFARSKGQIQEVRGNGAPAVSDAVSGLSLHYRFRRVEAVICTKETLPVSVEAVHIRVHAVEGVVVAPFPVFGLMVNGGTVNLHLCRREVALEVLHIRSRIPKAPFHEGEEFETLLFLCPVAEGELVNLAIASQRHEESQVCSESVFL